MRLSTNSIQQMGINAILDQQAQLSHTQQQLASGKKLLTPADDPVASTLALGFDQISNNNTQYTQNGTYAQNSLQLESTTLSSVQTTLQQLREQVVSGLNSTMSTADRQSIAQQMSQEFQQLQSLANTTDGAGNYIFAGGNSTTQPYTGDVNSGVTYVGGQQQQYLQISGANQVATNDPGSAVFGNITTNSGNSSISSGITVGGTGNGSIAAPGDTGPGQLTLTYDAANSQFKVSISGSSKTASPSTIAYNPATDSGNTQTLTLSDGTTLQFAISGTPSQGDNLRITDSSAGVPTVSTGAMDAFSIAGKAVTDMQNGTPDGTSLDQIDALISRISTVQAKVGGRLNAITNQQSINSDYNTQLAQTKASLTDLDYASAVGKMNTQMTGLQAAMKSYTQVQGLSLFNYL